MKLLHVLLIFASLVSFVFGIVFLLFPRFLLKCSEFSNKVFELDTPAVKYRAGLGFSFFFCAVFLFFMAYYFHVKQKHPEKFPFLRHAETALFSR